MTLLVKIKLLKFFSMHIDITNNFCLKFTRKQSFLQNLLKRKNIRKMPKDVVYLFDPNIGKYYYGKRFALKKSENF